MRVAQVTMLPYRVEPGWASSMARHCTKVWLTRSDLTDSSSGYPLATNQLRSASGNGESQL